MYEESEFIPVKWIEVYHYCPMIIYLMGVMGLRERETAFMEEGKKREEDELGREKRRKTLLAKRRERILRRWDGLELRSDRLKLIGRIDLVVETDEGLKVIDFKHTDYKELRPGYIYQTAAYGMLVEEWAKKPVRSVIVFYTKSGKVFEVGLTEEIRKHVEWTVKRIRSILSGKMPKVRRSARCSGCGYFRYCRAL